MTAPVPACVPSERVDATQHSQLYDNVFSTDKLNVDTVESIPRAMRQPEPCCFPRSHLCCSHDESAASEFRDVLELDVRSKTLLVSAGYTLGEIEQAIAPAGFILKGVPSAVSISIGGAVATGSHSGGLKTQPCSAYVLDIWIRNAHGEVIHISHGDPSFPAAAVSLGLLGAIIRIRLQCFEVKRNRRNTGTTMSTYTGAEITNINELTTSGFRYAVYRKKIVRYDETETDDPPSSPCCGHRDRIVGTPCLIYTIDYGIACFPWLAYITGQFLARPGENVLKGTNVASEIPTAPAYLIEYSVDVINAPSCFDELTVIVDRNRKAGRYISYQYNTRFIAAVDPSYVLAPSAGGDKATFEFTFSTYQRGVQDFIEEILVVLKKYEGRPHLGKTIRPQDVTHAAMMYGGSDSGAPFLAFEATRMKFDPHGKFLNGALRKFIAEAKAAALAAAARAAHMS